VKLIDFGIAKAMGRLTKTAAGSIKGKFGYMSPEQVSGRPVDPRSDIFACGTILYELASNQRLFRAETDIATMQLVRRAEVRPLSAVVPDVPGGLERILQRAMTREPAHRYTSAGDMLDDLEELAAETGLTCSSQQLSRWVNEVFTQDRKRAEAKAREAELRAERDEKSSTQPGRPVLEIVEVEPPPSAEPSGVSGPHLPPVKDSSVTGPALPAHLGTVTGQGTVTASFTGTRLVQPSRKPWIVVGVLTVVLVAGGLAVFFFWPRGSKTKVIKIPVAVQRPQARTEALHPTSAGQPDAAPAAEETGGIDEVPHKRSTRRRGRRSRAGRRAGRRTRTAARAAPGPTPKPVPGPTPKPVPAPTPAPARPAPRSPKLGILIVSSRPWARVWVDGVDTGRNTPIPLSAPLRLPPGRHVISLYVSNKKYDFTVVTRAGEVTKLIRKLPTSQ
jgi:hypothetical protein